MFTTMVAEPPVKPRMVPEPVSPAFQATQDTEVRSPPGSTLVTPDQVEAVGGPFTVYDSAELRCQGFSQTTCGREGGNTGLISPAGASSLSRSGT